MKTTSLIFTVLLAASSAMAGDLRPLITEKDAVVLQNDFSQSGLLPKDVWQPRQQTRWVAQDGVLHGQESTAEYQASRKDHQGFEPRLMIRNLPNDYVIEYRFRVNSGEYTAIGAFLEFGHHMARLSFQKGGAVLGFGDLKKTTVLKSDPNFHLEPGRWYRVIGEVNGDEVAIQIEGGPTFRGKHSGIGEKKDGFGLCGLRHGTMDIDDVTVWSVKAGAR